MLKVAVIGCGNIGAIHSRVYAEHGQTKLVAVCDVLREKADALADRFGAMAYRSVDDLLRNEDLDAVSVTTAGEDNGGDHFEPTMRALGAGKHVLCEKPLSNSLERAREMVDFAAKQGLALGNNLNHRFTPAAEKARQLIDAGRLGTPLFINFSLWIRNPKDSPWFHMRALHTHSIDVMRYFCGDVAHVHAFMIHAPGRQSWSTASVNMRFVSGPVGHLCGSYDMTTTHPIERCEVGGTEGRFVIDNVYERLTFYPHDSSEATVFTNSMMGGMGSFNDTFRNRIHRWVEQLLSGDRPVDASGDDAFKALAVVEAAIRSQVRGTIEDVSF